MPKKKSTPTPAEPPRRGMTTRAANAHSHPGHIIVGDPTVKLAKKKEQAAITAAKKAKKDQAEQQARQYEQTLADIQAMEIGMQTTRSRSKTLVTNPVCPTAPFIPPTSSTTVVETNTDYGGDLSELSESPEEPVVASRTSSKGHHSQVVRHDQAIPSMVDTDMFDEDDEPEGPSATINRAPATGVPNRLNAPQLSITEATPKPSKRATRDVTNPNSIYAPSPMKPASKRDRKGKATSEVDTSITNLVIATKKSKLAVPPVGGLSQDWTDCIATHNVMPGHGNKKETGGVATRHRHTHAPSDTTAYSGSSTTSRFGSQALYEVESESSATSPPPSRPVSRLSSRESSRAPSAVPSNSFRTFVGPQLQVPHSRGQYPVTVKQEVIDVDLFVKNGRLEHPVLGQALVGVNLKPNNDIKVESQGFTALMPQVQVISLHDEEKPERGGSTRWTHSDLGLSDKNTKKFETLVLPTILKWVGQHLNTWAIEDNDELYNQYAYARDSIVISVFGEGIFKTILMMRTRVLDTLVFNRINLWRNRIGEIAKDAVKNWFAASSHSKDPCAVEKFVNSMTMRDIHPMLFKEFDFKDKMMGSGMYKSPHFLAALGYHVLLTDTDKAVVWDDEDQDMPPLGAMAIATVALERAFIMLDAERFEHTTNTSTIPSKRKSALQFRSEMWGSRVGPFYELAAKFAHDHPRKIKTVVELAKMQKTRVINRSLIPPSNVNAHAALSHYIPSDDEEDEGQ